MKAFTQIDELLAKSFQPKKLETKDIQRLAMMTAILLSNHVDLATWTAEVREGSITLQNKELKGQVIKIFIDYKNKLANLCGLSLHDDPVAIGIELSNQPAYLREIVRDKLSLQFKQHYIDPRKEGNDKWWLKPIDSHKYDILFLGQGPCDFTFDERVFVELQDKLEKSIDKSESFEIRFKSE